jgi:hypothetical protein
MDLWLSQSSNRTPGTWGSQADEISKIRPVTAAESQSRPENITVRHALMTHKTGAPRRTGCP